MSDYELRDPVHNALRSMNLNGDYRSPVFSTVEIHFSLDLSRRMCIPAPSMTRFSHASGAMHVAGRLFGRVVESSSEIFFPIDRRGDPKGLRSRVRLAGLLHDIGHGPFSHASKNVFPSFEICRSSGRFGEGPADRQAVHEDYSVLLIQTLAQGSS